jgi:hypothetical protein
VDHLARHPSNTVRSWACFIIGAVSPMELGVRLNSIRPLADDPHLGVREWALPCWPCGGPQVAAAAREIAEAFGGKTQPPKESPRRDSDGARQGARDDDLSGARSQEWR